MIAAVFSPIKGLSTALESTATTRQLADCSPPAPAAPTPTPSTTQTVLCRHNRSAAWPT